MPMKYTNPNTSMTILYTTIVFTQTKIVAIVQKTCDQVGT